MFNPAPSRVEDAQVGALGSDAYRARASEVWASGRDLAGGVAAGAQDGCGTDG